MDHYVFFGIVLFVVWGWQLALTVALATAIGVVCGFSLPGLRMQWTAPFGFLVGLSVDVVGLWLLIFALPGLAADWMIYAFPLAGVVAVLAACTAWSRRRVG